MTSINSWEALAALSPAVSWVNRREGKRQWSDLGFAADEDGWVVLADLPAETLASLTESKASKGLPGWAPLRPDSKRFGMLGAIQAQLTVEGVSVADYRADDRNRCFLQLTEEYLLGSFPSGYLINGFEDGAPTRGNYSGGTGKGISVCWRWPLRDIEIVEVDRAKRMFKWWDAEFSISGAGGRSLFRCESINDYDKSLPVKSTLASDLLPFANVLAEAVAGARGLTRIPEWKVDADRSEESHEIRFVDSAKSSGEAGKERFMRQLRGEE